MTYSAVTTWQAGIYHSIDTVINGFPTVAAAAGNQKEYAHFGGLPELGTSSFYLSAVSRGVNWRCAKRFVICTILHGHNAFKFNKLFMIANFPILF